MKRLIIILLLCAGCTTLDDHMKSYIGMPVDELLSEWGSPDSFVELEDGTQIVTWTHYWEGGKCRKSFTINKGVVKNYSHRGCHPLVYFP